MPRLLVMRGDTLEQDVELSGQTVRIGRGPSSDLRLEDPGRSVSREHAEIRFEDGRYVLADLESQNGIWVSGTRMAHVVLEPNVVATIGPFRLLLETSGDSSVVPPAASGPYDEASRGPDKPSQPGQDRPRSPAGASAERSGQRPPAAVPWYRQYQMPLLGGGTALVLLSGGYALLRESTTPERVDYLAQLPRAQEMITAGNCEEALQQIIRPVLEQDPASAEAIRLEEAAETCLVPRPPPPPPPGPQNVPGLSTEQIDAIASEIQRLVGAGDCATASSRLDEALRAAPNVAAFDARRSIVAGCMPPKPPGPVTTGRGATPVGGGSAQDIPPEQAGLPVLPGENQENYLGRLGSVQAQFRRAERAFVADELQRALALFEDVQKTGTPRYRLDGINVAERIREIMTRLADARDRFQEEARKAEEAAQWRAAIIALGRAHDIDPSLDVTAAVARVQAKMREDGEKRCRSARAEFQLNQPGARNLYDEAVDLLADDHPCRVEIEGLFKSRR